MTDKMIWIAMIREMLTDALLQTKISEQRMVGTAGSIRYATRKVDREMLALNADSVRLSLHVVIELLRDSLDAVKNLERELKMRVWIVERHVSEHSDQYEHTVVAVCATEALARKIARRLFESEIHDVLMLRRESPRKLMTPEHADDVLTGLLIERQPHQGYPLHPRIEMMLLDSDDPPYPTSELFEEIYFNWRPAYVREENS